MTSAETEGQPDQKGGSSVNYQAMLDAAQGATEAKTKPTPTEAKMLGLDIQPWHDRAEALKAAGTRIIALRGAGSVNGIDPGDAERAVGLLQEKIAGLVEAGTPVALMYDGDGDNREKPDVGAVFGQLADAFKDNPSVTAMAAQTEGWYGEPDNGPIKSATGTPFETYVFDDGLPGAHDSLTQSPALVEYDGYEQVYVGPVGPIAEKQLGDVSTKAAERPAEAGPVPVTIIETKNNAALDSQLQTQLEAAADESARTKVQAKITQRESQPYGAFFAPDGKLALDQAKYPAVSLEVVKAEINPNELRRRMDHALQKGGPDELKALLDGGVSPDQEDHEGRTALMLRAAQGKKEDIEMLVARGADINRVFMYHDRIPNTALDAARQTGHTEIADILAGLGAKTGKEIAQEQANSGE